MLKYRDDLICEFAEEYHIYDPVQLPATLAATLAVGLRANSRVKTKIAGLPLPADLFLMAGISDKLSLLNWRTTGSQGNAPQLILPALMDNNEENNILAMRSGTDFDAEWERRTGRK